MILKRRNPGVRSKIDFKLILRIVGAFTLIMGFALILPIPIALAYNESNVWVYLLSSGFAFLIGGLLYLIFKPADEVRPREAFFIVSVTWIVLSLFGSTPFLLSGSLNDVTDAFFETMSGLTTTILTIVKHDFIQ